MKNHVYRKHNSARLALTFIWVILTALLLIFALYYKWQQYLLQKHEHLQLHAIQASVKLDNLIDEAIHSTYSLPLYGRKLNNCQHDLLPILRNFYVNNPPISGAVLSDEHNKIICSTLGPEYTLPAPVLQTPYLFGPMPLDTGKKAFLLQQRLGEYYLGVYIIQNVIENLLKSVSSENELIALYDDTQKKNILAVGNNSLSISSVNLTGDAPLHYIKGFRVVIATSPLAPNKDFFYQELPLSLVITLISFLLYFEFRTILNNRFSLRYALANALKQNLFQPVYQPIRGDLENRYCGAEVLLRWITDSNEVIMPDAFIEDAEKSGLIVPITLQLVEKTFQQSHLFLKRHPYFHLAFNLSASHFSDKKFFTSFYNLCANFQIPAQQLMLELTERELLDQDNPQLVARMRELRAKGYSLAIDDFGTGHASIKYLQHFPFNYLKIDKIFVQAIGTGAVTETLNQAIIHMARCLDLNIIAEGVETVEQLDFLRKNQVNLMQGWYFSKALSYERLIKIIEEGSG